MKKQKPTEAEKQAIKYARRSLVATGDIEEGTVITREMLTWKDQEQVFLLNT